MAPKKSNFHKFHQKWKSRKEFEGWLKLHPTTDDKVICSVCQIEIKAHLVDIHKHSLSKKHMNAIQLHEPLKLGLDMENDSQEEDRCGIIVEAKEEDIEEDYLPTEFFISENEDDSTDKDLTTHSKWTLDGIKTLLSHVKFYWKDFQDGLRKKKDIWEDIAKLMKEGGYDFNMQECSKKFRNIKLRYFMVMEKKMLGERVNLRIGYFDELHSLLANEAETVAYLECKKLNAQSQSAIGSDLEEDSNGLNMTEYDIAQDGDMEWGEVATILLMDLLLEFKDWFSSKEDEDEDTIWGIIAEQMKKEDFAVDKGKCKRKWQNLSSLYNHYNTIMNSTGTLPLWPYYTKVRHILNTVNISGVMKSTSSKPFGRPTKKPKLEFSENDSEASGHDDAELTRNSRTIKQLELEIKKHKAEKSNALNYVHKMRESASVWRRLSAVEAQLNDLSDQDELNRQTNSLLTQILGQLATLTSHLAPGSGQETVHQQAKGGITIVVPNSN